MQRITDKDLKALCDRLNRLMGAPMEPYTKQPDGSFRANPGNYHIDSAYGGFQLVCMSNESGGVSTVLYSGFVSRRELYNLMHAYLKGMEDVGL